MIKYLGMFYPTKKNSKVERALKNVDTKIYLMKQRARNSESRNKV